MLMRNNFVAFARCRALLDFSRIIFEWTIMPVNVTIDRVCFPVVTLLVVTMIIEEIPIRGFTKKKVKTSKTGIISQADRYSVVFCHTPKFFFPTLTERIPWAGYTIIYSLVLLSG